MSELKPGLAKVIPFRRPVPAAIERRPAAVTQERLKQGAALLAQEWRIVREMREFTLALQADLAAGAEIESGALEFDRELGMIRLARPAHPAQVQR